MLRSVYSGITGMRINQMWFDVIAENMANVNTPGFKKSRISFEDLLNQTFKGAMQPRGELGGTNPMQIGLGSTVSSIQVIHTQGTVKETQVSTDLMINGEGYLVVSSGGDAKSYTRAGNLGFDNSGNLVNLSNGYKVLGWNAERDSVTGQLIMDSSNKTKIDTSSPLKGLKISNNDIMSPKASTKLGFEGNLNAETKTAFDSSDLNLNKYVKSVVPVSKSGAGISLSNSWSSAGFENQPTGTITIGPKGYTSTFALGSKPQDLIDAINNNSATTGITMSYSVEDKFVLKADPTNQKIKEVGGIITVSETPASGKTGFFSEAKIPTGEYHVSIDINISFEHLLDPTNPDNIYFRWKAVNPANDKVISTNAYYRQEEDTGISPKQVTNEELGYGDGATYVFEFDNADVDPTSLQVYVEDPATGVKQLYSQYNLPLPTHHPQPNYTPPPNAYYFDSNGETEYFYNPITGNPVNIGKGSDGKDRVIIFRTTGTNGPLVSGSKITADYSRNGFNLSQSTVDQTTLEMKINGGAVDKVGYRFNNNLGEGGVDQITFFSTVSKEEVVRNSLDTSKSFEKAGFNVAPSLVMSSIALSSTITITWDGGSQTWTSGHLSSYATVADFLAIVEASVNGKAGTGLISFSYDAVEDRFKLTNKAGIYLWQSHTEGFLTHAKMFGEGRAAAGSVIGNYLPADTNPKSREEVVTNKLNLSKDFQRAGFNDGFKDAIAGANSNITFSWTTSVGELATWTSNNLDSYVSVNEFLDYVNTAIAGNVTSNTNALPITLRYDEKTDRFTIMNTGNNVRVRQSTSDGFLTKAKLLTTGLQPVTVPGSPYSTGDMVTGDYNYNKTVDAKGILQMNSDYKVINNFRDTEAVPEIVSSREVKDGSSAVNLAGSWNQFDSGTINGTITIATDSGTYSSKEINLSNYVTVQTLLNEINASDAKVSIEYDSTTDRFKIKSRTEGARISLSENGSTPFFSEINISLGTVEGGNNNGVMDLLRERPTPETGWADTTKASGTGKDFFRINVASNEVKAEKVGVAGLGKAGTQAVKLDVTGIAKNVGRVSEFVGGRFQLIAPTGTPPSWNLYLSHGDVDKNTIVVWRQSAGGAVTMVPKANITFMDNAGTGGEDMIVITANPTSSGDTIYIDYTRLNGFDLKNPDADPSTLVLKVNNVIQSQSDYTFIDGGGANGVDQVILDRSYGTGDVTVDYRQVSPLSADLFVPNGNDGPESLTFTPNTSVDTTYSGYKASDEGAAVISERNSGYLFNAPRKLYDALGVAWDTTFTFERLSVNRWVWSVLNPSSEKSKFAGYGLLMFDEKGDYDKENSKIFESPSDERIAGSKFQKGLLFDPGKQGSAPPPEKGAPAVQIAIDFAKIHQFKADKSDASITSQDGYAKGVLKSTTIDSQGVVVGSYSNDQVQEVGQIALAIFANPSGLVKESGTTFLETLNSGEAKIGTPAKDGRGTIQSGRLEMANVDLVEEFTDLIIAQRAFQANSRIIVTDDQVLTEIVNLKR
ncbi:MAG: flagellar hook-basal body complex protein [bacterium]|nr:flagellar hook-basal body complex protein [bacterium]